MPLADYKPLLTNLATGLAGAAVGGGAGYLGTGHEDGEPVEDFEKRRRGNAMIGAVGGGTTGAAAPFLYNAVGSVLNRKEGPLSKLVGLISPTRHPLTTAPLEGAVGGATAGGIIGHGFSTIGQDGKLISDPLASKLTTLKETATGAETAFKNNVDIASQALQGRLDQIKRRFELANKNWDFHRGTDPAAVLALPANERALYEAAKQEHMAAAAESRTAPNMLQEHSALGLAKANTDHLDAAAKIKEFESAVSADRGVGLRRFLPFGGGQAEKDLAAHMGTDKRWLYARRGSRIATIAGAIGVPIASKLLSE